MASRKVPQHKEEIEVLVLRSGPKDRVSKDGSVRVTELR